MTESTSQSLAADSTATQTAASEGDATGALAHLARMSGTGSSFGPNDYVAISPIAIVALMLGFASMSIVLSLFLFIPMLGIFFGLLAIHRVRNSGGTQSGIGFAIGGIILSMLVGGGVTAKQVLAAIRDKRDSGQCAQVLSKFGEEIRSQHFDAIYNTMTTEVFRGMVTPKRFNATLASVRVNPYYGELQNVRWAGNAIDFEPVAGTEARFAYAMMMLKFDKGSEPAREMVKLTDREGGWKIEVLPQLFPDPKKNPTGFPSK